MKRSLLILCHIMLFPLKIWSASQGSIVVPERIYVFQDHFAFAKTPAVLETGGVGPCFVVILYDEELRTAALAHVSAGVPTENLVNLFNKFPEDRLGRLKAHLLGGHGDDAFLLNQSVQILDLLRARGVEEINQEHLFEKKANVEMTSALLQGQTRPKAEIMRSAFVFITFDTALSRLVISETVPDHIKRLSKRAELYAENLVNQRPLMCGNKEEMSVSHFCDKFPNYKCGKCLKASYCSPECQKKHWPTHKKKCDK